MTKNKPRKNVAHQREKKCATCTHSHSFISCGTFERQLLNHLSKITSRFNLSAYAKANKVDRRKVYHKLHILEAKNLVKNFGGDWQITKEGTAFFSEKGGVQHARGGCAEISQNLSMHHIDFKMQNVTFPNDLISAIEELKPEKTKVINLRSWKQHILYFENCTIVVNTKTIILKIPEIVKANVEDCVVEAIEQSLEIVEKLKSVGISAEGYFLENEHWARVNSWLAESLTKSIGNGYEIQFKDGSKFWIDKSPVDGIDNIEDETDNEAKRQRLDLFLEDMFECEAKMSDIKELTKSVNLLLKLELMKRDFSAVPGIEKKEVNYFG